MAPNDITWTSDVNRVEAPMTARAYILCAFASFGGILFGYDSGYINGVLGMSFFKRTFGRPVPLSVDETGFNIATQQKSLIVSVLSLGTFVGALVTGSIAEAIGRRYTIMLSSFLFSIGVAIQVASTQVNPLIGGRLVAGLGVGGISSVVILYVSEIAPKKFRGAMVSVYQWAITIGLLVSACVNQATQNLDNSASYRIPIGLQLLWALILGVGLYFLPESPRYYVKKNKLDAAAGSLSRIRGQHVDSDYVKSELAEIVANYEYESRISSTSWIDCFKGGLNPSGNFRRVILGTALQMFQQLTGVNFIFYYGTTFFQQSGIRNAFLITIITNVVNVASTPASFYIIERFGRRTLLIWGAAVMLVCEFIIAAVGTALPGSNVASICLIVFVCIYICGFASTWGPGAWVLIGEIFPLPIRARGVALSTASNWLWNYILALITPYLVDPERANLGSKVFFIWGTTCTISMLFAYFFVYETKGLSLEQVDRLFEESSAKNSSKWKPHETFATRMGLASSENGVGKDSVTKDEAETV
ncbi:MFS monosaccharide transporter [Blastomyces gilchristii SLH14081]|uniref:MFS monosaccharide transporter n=1 Tax=Blastomyces gilchristii (strain SLH14081) TaxID=559298 RepID=A0A179V1U2_BLAGS|nr:MFS monosaccharide transporter [Blastomyces gilchristii SLH14081]OAT12572.1 MFS monosaccharide transporter [Blastomyces gilchristii SLH14081]